MDVLIFLPKKCDDPWAFCFPSPKSLPELGDLCRNSRSDDDDPPEARFTNDERFLLPCLSPGVPGTSSMLNFAEPRLRLDAAASVVFPRRSNTSF